MQRATDDTEGGKQESKVLCHHCTCLVFPLLRMCKWESRNEEIHSVKKTKKLTRRGSVLGRPLKEEDVTVVEFGLLECVKREQRIHHRRFYFLHIVK